MHKIDKLTTVQAVFCLLITGVVAGCGDDSKPETRLDAAVDRAGDALAADAAKTDTLVPADAAKPDGPQADAPTSDAAPPLDTAKVDGSALLDVGAGETGGVDGGSGLDGAAGDAPLELDTGAVDTGAFDGAGGLDGGATTMASITFRVENQGAQTVYLRSSCWIPFDVTSVADGAVYANAFFCACSCADASCTSQVACAPCAPPSGIAVAAGQIKDVSWQARKSTLENKTGSLGAYQCVAHAPIPTGTYRLAISVYPSEADAAAGTNGRVIQQSFMLGGSNATVVVPVP